MSENDIIPFVINDSRKAEYYHALNTAQTKQDYSLLERFFREEQAEYRQQVEGFLPRSKNSQRHCGYYEATATEYRQSQQVQKAYKTAQNVGELHLFSSRCDANTSHSTAPTPKAMRSNRTGRTTDNRLFRWNGRFFVTVWGSAFMEVKSRLLRRLLCGSRNDKRAAMPRLLSWGFTSFKIVYIFIISDVSAKAQGKTQIAAKFVPGGISVPYPSAVAGTGTPPRSGARRRSPAPLAAPSDARRSALPSVLHKRSGMVSPVGSVSASKAFHALRSPLRPRLSKQF